MFFKGRNKLTLALVILHDPLTEQENQTYFFRPPVRLAAPLRTVFLAAVFRLVVFRAAVFRLVVFRAAVFRLVVFRAAVFRLVVFRATVFRLVVFRAVVLRAGLRAVVFRADALRLLVAFFFFAGAMLTKPLQTLLVIVNAANSTRPSNLNKHVSLNQRRCIVIQLCQTRNC